MKSLLCLLLGLLPTFVHAVDIPVLKGVSTGFEGKDFVSSLTFDRPVKSKDFTVDYINQTVQINIPNTTISTGKQLNRVGKDGVKSVYTYQYQPDLLRSRIIFDKDSATVHKGKVEVTSSGNKVFVKIKKENKIATPAKVDILEDNFPPPIGLGTELSEKLTTTAPDAVNIVQAELSIPTTLPEKKKSSDRKKVSLASVEKKSAKRLVEKTKEKKSVAKKETKKSTEVEKAVINGSVDGVKTEKDGLFADSGKLKINESATPVFAKKSKEKIAESQSITRLLYSFGVIALLALGLFAFNRWWSKNSKTNHDTTKINVLTTHHLGPKKSLSIVRVAGEYILLGVTDHNISMIKTLSLIDDEYTDVPTSFNKSIKDADKKPEPSVKQKVTYYPENKGSGFDDVGNQIREKLKGMRSI